jgi:hypothetical protein
MQVRLQKVVPVQVRLEEAVPVCVQLPQAVVVTPTASLVVRRAHRLVRHPLHLLYS